jgi:two-component system NtrC family sensor kinase
VEDLLNFSRQTKARRFPTDLNGAIETVAASLEEEFRTRGLSIVRDYAASLPALAADEDKLKRVFTNLLTNSMQAMEPGGSVTIRTEHDLERNGLKAVFTDTGSGIPKKVRDKIFEPFFTTKPPGQGTGLGLAVSYGIVQEHKGEIGVESEEGKGASFTLWFPLEAHEI